jgi:hypothetical protein
MSFKHRKRAFRESSEEAQSSPVLGYGKRTREAVAGELTASTERDQYSYNRPEFGFKVLVPGVSPTIE